MSVLDKFSKILEEEQRVAATQAELAAEEKEGARQGRMAELKTALDQMEIVQAGKADQEAELRAQEEQLKKERESVKQDGRETVASAKAAGRLDLLRAKAKELFSENINRLKGINEKVKEGRASRKELEEESKDLDQSLQEYRHELSQLETAPVRERIEELEREFNEVKEAYRATQNEIKKRQEERGSIGLRSSWNNNKELWLEGDIYGSPLDYLKHLDQVDADAYEKERLPLNKALDKLFAGLSESARSRMQQPNGQNTPEYKQLLQRLFQPAASEKKEKDIITELSYKSLSPEDLKIVRAFSARYHQLGKELTELDARQKDLYTKLLSFEERRRHGLSQEFQTNNKVKELKEQLERFTAQSDSNLNWLRQSESEVPALLEKKGELEKKLSDCRRHLLDQFTATGYFPEEISQYQLNERLAPRLQEALSAGIKKEEDDVKQSENEARLLQQKTLVLGKKDKLAAIETKIANKKEMISRLYKLYKNAIYPQASEEKDLLQQIERTESNLRFHKRNVEQAPGNLKAEEEARTKLEADLKQAIKEQIEIAALKAAHFQR